MYEDAVEVVKSIFAVTGGKKMTNREWIEQMTDEEWEEWLEAEHKEG